MIPKLRNMTSLYLVREDAILCLYRIGSKVVSNRYIGSAGGHFEKDELNNATKCVLRELQEELGLKPEQILNLSLRYVSLRNMDDEIRQNYYFFAELSPEVSWDLPSSEGTTRWFSLNEIAALPMPFTAKYAMLHYVQTGQYDDVLYGGIGNDNGIYLLTAVF